MKATLLLYETTLGYGLYEYTSTKIHTLNKEEILEDYHDLISFKEILKLFRAYPFSTAASAIKNISHVGGSKLTDDLISFITTIPHVKRHQPFLLGIQEFRFGVAIKEKTGVTCICTKVINKLFRGIRSYLAHGLWLRSFIESEILTTQLHLAHIHSRTKVKQNPIRTDFMITQAVELVEVIEKDAEISIICLRRWYGMHFPELNKLLKADYSQYAKVALLLMNKSNVTSKIIPHLCSITSNKETAKAILKAAKISTGKHFCQTEFCTIKKLAQRVINIINFRKMVYEYLHDKMNIVAPNLSALIGPLMGAQLIRFEESLTGLAKCSSSSLQILMLEKNLLRHVFSTYTNKSISQSVFLNSKNRHRKGRLLKYIANKCTMAARIDAFMEGFMCSSFGKKLREQVEQRILIYSQNNYGKIMNFDH